MGLVVSTVDVIFNHQQDCGLLHQNMVNFLGEDTKKALHF